MKRTYLSATIAGAVSSRVTWAAGLRNTRTRFFAVAMSLAATNLNAPIPWAPLLTTNVPAMPFDFVDFDVKLSEKPQKYYRVRQP